MVGGVKGLRKKKNNSCTRTTVWGLREGVAVGSGRGHGGINGNGKKVK